MKRNCLNCYIKKIVASVQSLRVTWLYYPIDCSVAGLPATVQKHEFSPQGFLRSSDSKDSACSAGDQVRSLGREDPLQKNMATHSTIRAWKIPWTEEPGGLQSRGPHDWATNSNSLLYGLNLSSVHNYWKDCSFDSMKLSRQSDVSAVWVCHCLCSKKQMSSNFMAAVTIHNDFGAQEEKICHCFHFFPFYLPWGDGTGCHDLIFFNVEF